MNIDETLKERGSRYGEFPGHAGITQGIKYAMSTSQNWATLEDDMRECLEMVAHKIGRILNGDPDYIDSWTDIIGYTRLVEKRLIDEQATAKIFAFPPIVGGAKESPTKTTESVVQAADEKCDCVFCQLEQIFGKQDRA